MLKKNINTITILAFIIQILYELFLFFKITHNFYLIGFLYFLLDDKKPMLEGGMILLILAISIVSLIIGRANRNIKYFTISILLFETLLLLWRIFIPLLFSGIKSI